MSRRHVRQALAQLQALARADRKLDTFISRLVDGALPPILEPARVPVRPANSWLADRRHFHGGTR